MADTVNDLLVALPIKEVNEGTLLYIFLVIIAAYAAIWIFSFLLKALSDRFGQYRIAVTTIIPLFRLFVYASALYLIISAIIEPSLSLLLAFSGLFGAGLGAALGLGLKDLFADIVGGVVITFEKPYQIGDKVTIGDHYGEVKDIGLRATRIVTPDDTTVSVPNYLLFAQAVSSGNAGKTAMMVVTDLFISSESDSGATMKILRDAVITSKYVYISPENPFTVILDDFPYYRRVRAKAYVNDLRYEFEFRSEVTRRAWIALNQAGISPPHLPVPVMPGKEKN